MAVINQRKNIVKWLVEDKQGMNAEGWARERGHSEVADLIQIGL